MLWFYVKTSAVPKDKRPVGYPSHMIKMEFKKYNYGNQPEKETEKNRKEKSQTKSSYII